MNLLQQLSKKAFWDVDMQTMDEEKHAAYIIEKVFEYGTLPDMLATTRFYGAEKVKKTLAAYQFFLPDSASFAAVVFDMEKDKLKCFSPKPLRQPATLS